MFCFLIVSGILVFLAVSWLIDKAQKPSFIEPRIVAGGPYEPRPYYPEKKIVPEQLKDWVGAEIINRVTE